MTLPKLLQRAAAAVLSATTLISCGAAVSPVAPPTKAVITLAAMPSPAPETVSTVPCDGTAGSRLFGPYQLILRENEGVAVEITDVTYRYIGGAGTPNSQSAAWTKAQIQQRFDSSFLPPRGVLQSTRTACVPAQGIHVAIEYTITGTDDGGNRVSTTERVPFNTGIVLIGSSPAVALRIDGQRTLRPGATAQMKAIAILSDGRSVEIPHSDVVWTTDEPSVATISSSGILAGVQRGETQLRVSYKGLTDATRVAVALPVDVSGSWSGTLSEGKETWGATFVLMQAPFKVPHTDYYKVTGTYWYKGNVWCGDLAGRLIEPGDGVRAELDLTMKPVPGCSGSTGSGVLTVDVDILQGTIGDSEGSASVFLVRRRRP